MKNNNFKFLQKRQNNELKNSDQILKENPEIEEIKKEKIIEEVTEVSDSDRIKASPLAKKLAKGIIMIATKDNFQFW